MVVDELARASAASRVPRHGRHGQGRAAQEARDGRPEWIRCEAMVHLGACTDATETDEHYLFQNNVLYSERLLAWATAQGVPFLYASSAAVYGHGPWFLERPEPRGAPQRLRPIEVALRYNGFARCSPRRPASQVVGLRYFNVYGLGEAHKGAMASMVFHLWAACRAPGARCDCSERATGWGAQQRRDFVPRRGRVGRDAVVPWSIRTDQGSSTSGPGPPQAQRAGEPGAISLRRARHRVRADARRGTRRVPRLHVRRPFRSPARRLRGDVAARRGEGSRSTCASSTRARGCWPGEPALSTPPAPCGAR